MSEIAVVGVVALVVVGPQKLPGMLRTIGQWTGKIRRMTLEMRAQTGIDEILREEGIDGVAELRSLLRGEASAIRQGLRGAVGGMGVGGVRGGADPYDDNAASDDAIEYPPEGVDAAGAIPEDLIARPKTTAIPAEPATESTAEQPATVPEQPTSEQPLGEPAGEAAPGPKTP